MFAQTIEQSLVLITSLTDVDDVVIPKEDIDTDLLAEIARD